MQDFFKTRQNIIVILLIALSFGGGVFVGTTNRPEIEKVMGVSNKNTEIVTTADFAPFWKVWNTINEKYPKADEAIDQNRVYGAIAGLVD